MLTPRAPSRQVFLPLALFLAVLTCLYWTPVQDGDLFWHVRTGQWIWEHGTIPDRDPFGLVTPTVHPTGSQLLRADFTLKQYWLSQLFLYGIWHNTGNTGIIALRVLCYTGILTFLFFWMRRISAGIFPFVCLFLAGDILRSFPSERPQIISFMFFPLLLYLLESVTPSCERERPRLRPELALWGLMLLWANCHGGYLLGILVILIHLVCLLLPTSGSRFNIRTLLTLVVAMAVTMANPASLASLLAFVRDASGAGDMNLEFLPPYRAARDLGIYLPSYWVVLAVTVGTIAVRFRTMKLHHTGTLALLVLLSLTGLRFIPFLALAIPLLAPYLYRTEWRFQWPAVTLAIGIWAIFATREISFGGSLDRLYPQKAVQFIAATRPPAEIFNYYDWGGYLMCHAPEYKAFIDGRALLPQVYDLYSQALFEDTWGDVFERYGINTVLVPGVSKSTGGTYPLVTNLAFSPQWRLVHMDESALVFVRGSAANAPFIAKHALDGKNVQRHILLMLDLLADRTGGRIEHFISKGNASLLLDDRRGAAEAFGKALLIDPGNEWANRMLRQLATPQ